MKAIALKQLLAYSTSNDAVGQAYVINREVGETCSPTCPLHPKSMIPRGTLTPACVKCFSERTETFRPKAKACGKRNRNLRAKALKALLRHAANRKRPIRAHERGDYGNGKPHKADRAYVRAWRDALREVPQAKVWAYTHVYARSVANLASAGLALYASIHNAETLQHAKSVGFRRFETILPFRNCKPCNAILARLPVYDGPRFVELWGERFLVCPKQMEGKGRKGKGITCAECRWCIESRGNVAHLSH